MKKFWETSKKPLIIGIIASILYIIDALIGGLFVANGSFMWVAFAFWTVFFGSSIKERITAIIGSIIGFFAAVIMMLITNSFTLNIYTISISCLLGVFLINALIMYLEKTEKIWTNNMSGVFVGIMLTFSGLGKSLNPLNNISELFTILSVIVVYGILGLLCGYFSIYFTNKFSKKQPTSSTTDESNN